MRYTEGMIEEAGKRLRERIKPGETVYVIQRHRAAGSRVLSLVVVKEGRCVDITLQAAMFLDKSTQERQGKEGIRTVGSEANFAHMLVGELSSKLFEEDAPKGKRADPDSPDLRERPADKWLLAEWL